MRQVRWARFSIGTLMLLVLAGAPGSALFVKVKNMVALSPTGARYEIDLPAFLILCIGLNALVLATVRRHSSHQFLLAIAIACALLLGDIHLFEYKGRVENYAIAINLAGLLVAPFILRQIGRRKKPRTRFQNVVRKFYRAYAVGVINLLILIIEFGLQMGVYTIYQ